MKKVVIIEACRSAIGNMGGALKPLQPDDLSTAVAKAALTRIGLAVEAVDLVIFGHCRQSSDNPNIARLTALRAGLPEEVPAYTVMNQCASGMTAVGNAAMNIQCGQAETALAGGVESMSNAVFYVRGARYGLGTGNAELLDSITEAQLNSQPRDIYGSFGMGMTAENVAERLGISRAEQDEFAYSSQQKAASAIHEGRFAAEIAPLAVPQRKGEPLQFDTDEFPRETTLGKLAQLKPAFRFDGQGTVTAGNSSGRNDGAAALLLMTAERAVELGLTPLAAVRSFASAGVSPQEMGLGPLPASKLALQRAGLSSADIGLVELNEAFAAQALGCLKQMDFDPAIVNVNGGAIALGHPIGASGARIIVTLLHEMKKRGVKYGLATLCVAGGLGSAMVLELA